MSPCTKTAGRAGKAQSCEVQQKGATKKKVDKKKLSGVLMTNQETTPKTKKKAKSEKFSHEKSRYANVPIGRISKLHS